ncbi:MAG: hypothetical protein KGJ02_03045 [Verrucomicrobiota bacterium]|nr:hypothetical protein [Verrucomicrobiota bacterium]
MDSFHTPIGPHDPYKDYKVEEIGKDKLSDDKITPPEKEPDESLALGAYLLSLFRKCWQIFQKDTERGVSTETEKEVRANLLKLKAALEILKKEDRSQDTEFLNSLSHLWHQTLEDHLRFKRGSSFSTSFRTFVRDLQHFPEGQEHSLGYYLSEYAGEKWLPFPYLELIQKIYREHQQSPSTSALTRWTEKIDQLSAILEHH